MIIWLVHQVAEVVAAEVVAAAVAVVEEVEVVEVAAIQMAQPLAKFHSIIQGHSDIIDMELLIIFIVIVIYVK